MPINPIIFDGEIDLASTESKNKAGEQLSELIQKLIKDLFFNLEKLDLSLFSFEKNYTSGLTGYAGLYLIINKKKKKIYLGGASDLAQRKGDHHRTLNNPAKRETKLATSIRTDLKEGLKSEAFLRVNDFYFIPLSLLPPSNFKNFDLTKKTQNEEIAAFLDNYVEKPLLELFLNSPDYLTSPLKEAFYNVKTEGKFTKGNKYGGSPNSGQASKPVCFENFAWESISAAANCFAVDEALVRSKIKKNLMAFITTEEFNSFSGTKIFNKEAKAFLASNPTDYSILLQTLFPNVAKKRAKNGEL